MEHFAFIEVYGAGKPWVATLPFSKYNIDPERIEAMRAAFHRVCEVLRLECGRDDRTTEAIVMKIVQLAKSGELDPERLCVATLAVLKLSGISPARSP